jgi:hypothetical protein
MADHGQEGGDEGEPLVLEESEGEVGRQGSLEDVGQGDRQGRFPSLETEDVGGAGVAASEPPYVPSGAEAEQQVAAGHGPQKIGEDGECDLHLH